MTRINTNISALIGQNVLNQQNQALNTSLERLSTGLRINSGADDPSGLIASQSLQSQAASINAAIGNANSAGQVVSTADGALSQVNSLLLQVQGLVTSTANATGLSPDEKAANQQQIDSILSTINQISSTTNFAGTQLLNGNLDFQVKGQSSSVTNFQVNAANFSTTAGSSVAVNTVVTQSAHHGALYLSAGGTKLDLTNATSQFSFDLAGANGTQSFSFASGTSLASIASSINNFSSVTGVSAKSSGNIIKLETTSLGSDQFVSVRVTNAAGQAGSIALASTTNENTVSTTNGNSTSFSSLSGSAAIRDTGQDVGAIINGIKASGNGLTATVDSSNLAISLTLTKSAAQTAGTINALTITGGGATFNLGANVNLGSQVRLGIGSVSTDSLGNTTDGFLSDLSSGGTLNVVTGNLQTAQTVVNDAINQVSDLQRPVGCVLQLRGGFDRELAEHRPGKHPGRQQLDRGYGLRGGNGQPEPVSDPGQCRHPDPQHRQQPAAERPQAPAERIKPVLRSGLPALAGIRSLVRTRRPNGRRFFYLNHAPR